MSNEPITTEDEAPILDAIDRWLERDVRDKVAALERADEDPHEMVAQMRELGLFGATIPAQYGGLGLPAGIYAKIVTRISEVWMSLSMRIHGGYGYSTEFPVERLYRDAPLLCIGEGTNEMQRIIIARQLVARNPA